MLAAVRGWEQSLVLCDDLLGDNLLGAGLLGLLVGVLLPETASDHPGGPLHSCHRPGSGPRPWWGSCQ